MAYTKTEVQFLARPYTASCLKTLAGIAASDAAPPSARVQACAEILSRAWGKPATHLTAAEGETTAVRGIAWLDILHDEKLPPQEEPPELLQLTAEEVKEVTDGVVKARKWATKPSRRVYMKLKMRERRAADRARKAAAVGSSGEPVS